MYKATKVRANGDVKTNGRATVDDDNEDDDIEAGPSMPLDEEDAGPEDEEGRFFGGGITSNTRDVLDFMDEQDKDELVRRAPYPYWISELLTVLPETRED